MQTINNAISSNKGFHYLKGNKENISFKGESKNNITIPKDQRNVQKLLNMEENFRAITKEIGGIKGNMGMLDGIDLAKNKIKLLSIETQKAWSNCPKILEQKLAALKNLSTQLDVIKEQYFRNTQDIASEPGGLLLPEKKKLLTDSLEVSAIYNKVSQSPTLLKKNFKPVDFVTLRELHGSLSDIDKPDWNYKKLNFDDSQLYKKLKGQLMIGEYKQVIAGQIDKIDEKLVNLKEKGFKHSKETNLNVYDLETTGKILALETAKLRRKTLSDVVIRPEFDENLEKPGVLMQPTPVGKSLVFAMDSSFEPQKYEMAEVLNNNAAYKPVLEKLFPKGLPVYTVPGYSCEKFGDLIGGESIPNHPDMGIWLNSYDTDKKYEYMSSLENIIARTRDVFPFKSSVLKGNDDRARALAHEIGHVVSYKIINNDSLAANNTPKTSFILSSDKMNFMEGWGGLRMNSKQKLNGNELNQRLNKNMSNSDKANLEKFVDYETVAEDIRMAITGKKLEASSRMTGIYDQSREGVQDFKKVMHYIQEYLLKNKKPSEIILELMSKLK